MQEPRHSSHGPVPFSRFFAVFGYLIFALLVIPILVELGAFACWSLFDLIHPNPRADLMTRSPVYDGYPWAHAYWQEEKSRERTYPTRWFVPFRTWGVVKWRGSYVNTDDAEMGTWRRTINPVNKECQKRPALRVWVFGGSTVYGTGVPDFATLPSYLSRQLNTDPANCVEVTNLGVEGYVTNQEVILLIDLLKAGRRPDMAIFYDGVNDAYVGAFSPGVPAAFMNSEYIEARVEGSLRGDFSFVQNSYSLRLARRLTSRFHRRDAGKLTDDELNARARATLQNYEANIAIVQGLAGACRFKAYFFWQPALYYGDKPLVPFEQELVRIRSSDARGQLARAMKAVYEEAARRSQESGTFVFLGRVFDQVREPVYVDDWMHLGPVGNELVAQATAERIELDAVAPLGTQFSVERKFGAVPLRERDARPQRARRPRYAPR